MNITNKNIVKVFNKAKKKLEENNAYDRYVGECDICKNQRAICWYKNNRYCEKCLIKSFDKEGGK